MFREMHVFAFNGTKLVDMTATCIQTRLQSTFSWPEAMQDLFRLVWTQTLPCFQISIKGKQSTHTSCYHCSPFLISAARCRHKIEIKGSFLPLLDSLCPPCEGAKRDHVKRYISMACLRSCCCSAGFSQSLRLSSQASAKESKQPPLPKDGLFCPSQTKPSVWPWRSTPCFATDAHPGPKAGLHWAATFPNSIYQALATQQPLCLWLQGPAVVVFS